MANARKEERRKHPRYIVSEEQVLITGPKIVLSGNLMDVSQSGLAFSYKEGDPFRVDTLVRIDIARDDVYVLDIPAKIISDIEVASRPNYSRRCGVEFGILSRTQKERIDFLIKKFSSEP